ncbi:hypothetical protein ACFYNX_26965 [Streptomyces sp. NPDC007872]
MKTRPRFPDRSLGLSVLNRWRLAVFAIALVVMVIATSRPSSLYP